ncbi:hypothetical protein ASPWEDRAFT_174330 [Aspergillus wentii DTO 134E9]|uniref:Uncharacterized protein n=1 Tax=Aspergillus wentii DTO 134E9 TaxID=1073089 RepID=A0A1L9RD92_ASPWE|nr:uncharacterized protein ASPWEDRAFT_174330 [Aspergillus wentii DTO 134E9]OJJ32900.1 hypothetical protein ASPWEDRAFT_174330 [Aspergillus wentii DTO 134E9]
MKKPSSNLHTIILPSKQGEQYVHPTDSDPTTRQSLIETLHANMLNCSPPHTWTGDIYQTCSPHPVLVTPRHKQQVEVLSEALSAAIIDIVNRWWKDTEARFPERMPIEPFEEDLLRWLDSQPTDVISPFETRAGSWRPDMLLEPAVEGGIENYRICEINARFCWNGFMLTAIGQQALLDMGVGRNGVKGVTDPEIMKNGLNSLYNRDLPLHLCKGEEYGYDIHLYTYYAESIGIKPRFVHPADLRLIESPQSPGGYRLYCLAQDNPQNTITNAAGETLEEVHQIGLELHQRELAAMSAEMLQQLSLRCFSDMRSILLVHDKRLLGIVLQELDNLVARNVLTTEQAAILNRGIVPTTLPGSPQLTDFITQSRKSETLKNAYILKPVRSGKGAGILFGDQLSQEEWLAKLEPMRNPRLVAGMTTYVVQQRVEHNLYKVFLHESDGVQHFPFIGTFMMMHGKFLGLGLWRSGPGRICALSRGGAWICSVEE